MLTSALVVLFLLQNAAAGVSLCICFDGTVAVETDGDTCCSQEHSNPSGESIAGAVDFAACIDCISISIPAVSPEMLTTTLVGKSAGGSGPMVTLVATPLPLPELSPSPPLIANDARPIYGIASRVIVIRV